MPIRVLVADQEPIARRRVRRMLRLEPDVDVIDEVGSGREAIEAIRTLRPDVVLLDVQIPEVDGFGVVDALGLESMPPTIFVTASSECAVRAFEVNAIDFLLEPYDEGRFRSAFQRARCHLELRSSAEQGRKIRAMLEQVLGEDRASIVLSDRGGASASGGGGAAPSRTRCLDRLMVKGDGRVSFVKVSDVDWFEASGNYVRVHVGAGSHLIRETMHHIEAQLDPSLFVRIHRAVIVNIDRIKELQPWFAGDYVVILRDGHQLRLSRTYREHLQSRMHRFA